MSVFTPHPSAPDSVRQIQRTMIIQVVYVVIFAGLNESHRGDYNYYQPSEGLIALQALLGLALLGCAYGVGQLAPWSLPVSLAVEAASLALGIYSLVDSHSGLAAGFIIAAFNLYRLAQSDAQRALKAGPQPFMPNPYAGQQFGQPFPGPPFPGQPFPGQPFPGQPYGPPQTPYGGPQTPYGGPPAPYGDLPAGQPTQPQTDFYGKPIQPDAQG